LFSLFIYSSFAVVALVLFFVGLLDNQTGLFP
jgi:hypothetical protein